MPTPIWIDSFKHKTADTGAGPTAGSELYNSVSRPAGISFVDEADGVVAIQIVEDGVTATNVGRNIAAGNDIIVASFVFNGSAAPSVMSRCFLLVADLDGRIHLNTDGTIGASCGGSGQTGPNVVDGADHRIDLRYDTTPATHTLDWSVDGTAQTQATGAGVAGSDITAWRIGSNLTAHTLTFKAKHLVLSATSGDHPIGAHTCLGLVPNADGTHSPSPSVQLQRASDGAVFGAGVTAWNLLDEWPATTGTNNADTVTQAALQATEYVEVAFADLPAWATSTLWGVVGVGALQADSTALNNGTTRIVDSAGTTLTDIYAGDMSQTTAFYKAALITAPGGGWTPTNYNGAKGRVGFSGDATPDPEWLSLMLQVATPDVPPAAVDVPFPYVGGGYFPAGG